MVASACLTLAVIYFLVWSRDRTAWPHLLFSVTAASTTGYAFCELWVMRAQTPAEFQEALRWAQVGLFFLFVSITWFVRIYLRAGRPWLWTVTGLRTFYAADVPGGINVNYREVSSLRTSGFWENPSRPSEEASPVFGLFGQFAVVLMLVLSRMPASSRGVEAIIVKPERSAGVSCSSSWPDL
jgi:hypothetical protein